MTLHPSFFPLSPTSLVTKWNILFCSPFVCDSYGAHKETHWHNIHFFRRHYPRRGRHEPAANKYFKNILCSRNTPPPLHHHQHFHHSNIHYIDNKTCVFCHIPFQHMLRCWYVYENAILNKSNITHIFIWVRYITYVFENSFLNYIIFNAFSFETFSIMLNCQYIYSC